MIGGDDENGQRPSRGGPDASVLREDVLKTLGTHLDAIESTGCQIRDFSLHQTDEGFLAEFEVGPTNNGEQSLGITFTAKAGASVEQGERSAVDRNGENSNGSIKFIDSLWEDIDDSNGTSKETESIHVESEVGEHTATDASQETTTEGEETVDGEEPYKDPERLREVYDEHDTFPEMRDALGVEVTPQTIRRHMIEHGIHEVSSNETLEALKKMGEKFSEEQSETHTARKSYKKIRGES